MAIEKGPIYTALFANLGIAATRFVAADMTGSSAMISEGIQREPNLELRRTERGAGAGWVFALHRAQGI